MHKSNKVTINTIANLISKLWGFISIFIFIPFYIDLLSNEEYGLVTFFVTFQAVIQLLGLGLSNTLRREFARDNSDLEVKTSQYMNLRNIETIYIIIGVIFVLFSLVYSKSIATNWLNLIDLNVEYVSRIISLMSISIALQFLGHLWNGALIGLEYQIEANVYSVIWSILKSVGSLLILMFYSQNLIYFYSWHILTDILYILILRLSIIRHLNLPVKIKWSIKEFKYMKHIWKYAMGVFIISLISLVTRQFDKILISRYLTLNELAIYNTIQTLGKVIIIIISSVSIAQFSNFTKLYTTKDYQKLKNNFMFSFQFTALILIAIATYLAYFSDQLVLFWTNNLEFSIESKKFGYLIILGSLFLALQELPYYFLLAQGNTKINNILGIIFLPVIIILDIILIDKFGLFGASIVYFGIMFLQFITYIAIVYKKFIVGNFILWIVKVIVTPFIIVFISAFIVDKILVFLNLNIFYNIIIIILSGGISLLILLLLFERRRLKVYMDVLIRKVIK